MKRSGRRNRAVAVVAAIAAVGGGGALIAGCGGSGGSSSSGSSTTTQSAATATATGLPPSLKAAESAAEDVMDLALKGDRAKVVTRANDLAAAAQGEASAAALAGGVSKQTVDAFKTRAAEVAKLAPNAPLVDVGLAASRTFELAPDLFRPFSNQVPVDIIALDYLDFEAKLQATAGNSANVTSTADKLVTKWDSLRGQVQARDAAAAAKYDQHVATLAKLARGPDLKAVAGEAQHGLDLVDVLEKAFTR